LSRCSVAARTATSTRVRRNASVAAAAASDDATLVNDRLM
jgi:hypothetical protein